MKGCPTFYHAFAIFQRPFLMESNTCNTCQQPIEKGTGKTELACGHAFHPSCIHTYFRGTAACPSCPQSKGPLLDFGDNVHIANATRELVYTAAQSNLGAKRGALSWLTDRLTQKGNYPALAPADDLVHWKAPIAVFVERGITATNLAESGIKLDQWFSYGYSLEDLQKLGVTWNDFVFMGFGAHMLKFVPASFLVSVLKIDASHLLQVGIGVSNLSQAGYTQKDLLALKCTTHTLLNMGMQPEQMKSFNITEKEWAILGLQD
jgi:hypothetical protein